MREFIGNPNKDEYYEEDDVESEIFYDGADNFIYLDPNDMGIEIDDDDEEEEEEDEDFESLSLGDHFSSEDDDDYIDDEDEEESLSVEVQELVTEAVNFESSDRVTYHDIKNITELNDTDSDYTQSSDDSYTVIGESRDSSSSS